jgi:hypothetical protein
MSEPQPRTVTIKAVKEVTFVTDGFAITFALGAVSVNLPTVLQGMADALRYKTTAEAAALCQRMQYLPPGALEGNLLPALQAEAKRFYPYLEALVSWDEKPSKAQPFSDGQLVYISRRAGAVVKLSQSVGVGGNAVKVSRALHTDWAALPWFALQTLYHQLVNKSVRATVTADFAPVLPHCRVCGRVLPLGHTALCGAPYCKREDTRRRQAAFRQKARNKA